MKFLRNYKIEITTPSGHLITIRPPITAQIDTDLHVMASASTGTFVIYNLSPETRSYIYKDRFQFQLYWKIIVSAGYGNDLIEIFKGNITEAYSYKQRTEWITHIDAFDGAYAIQNGFVAQTFSSNTSFADMVSGMVKSTPGLIAGVLGSPTQKTSTRGQTFVGPSYDAIQGLTGNQAFIDREKLHVLGQNEAIAGDMFELTSENIFQTPRRRDTYLEVVALFSPEVRIARICRLTTRVKRFDGEYMVFGVKHSVLISEAQMGEATSTIALNAGSAPFTLENDL